MTYSAAVPNARHRATRAVADPGTRRTERRTARRHAHRSPFAMRHLGIPEALGVLALAAALLVAPPVPKAHAESLTVEGRSMPLTAQGQPRFDRSETQHLTVAAGVESEAASRDAITATPGERMLVAEGTNESWAKLVMMYGGWPQTDANVQTFMQWMRQENGVDDWWNRNNPLNNGWGSGGGGGFGSYDTLTTGAKMAAENLHRPLFSGIASCFAAGNGGCKDAIVASPWAASHYANGAHWSFTPVTVVKAPADAWGQ